MSQAIFSNIDPEVTTGLMLAGLLDDFKDAVTSGFSGTARPPNLQAGGLWVDVTQQAAPSYSWSLKVYTGTTDLEVFRVSVLTGSSGASSAQNTFTIRKISADAVGPILNLVKNRIADGGKVLSGDTIAELRITGRTNTSTDPIVAYLRATASENMTSLARGVIFSMVSTPVSTSSLIEHLRFLDGIVETTRAHKLHALVYGSDSVATTANITLTSDKVLTELTGSTAASIHGIEVGTGETRLKHIHNRSTAEIVIAHESSSASAAERFKLPDSEDLLILPNGGASFFYCEADSRWKFLMGAAAGVRSFIRSFPNGYSEWVAPFTGNVRVICFQEQSAEAVAPTSTSSMARLSLRGATAWGRNQHGQLGCGDTTSRSAPTAVVGGVQFRDIAISDENGCGIDLFGNAYAWGQNANGELGLGDVVPRSSPVAVLGGLSFCRVEVGESSYGQLFSGISYAWGNNQHGQLGHGDVVPKSSPVAVLGGIKFAALFHGSDEEGSVFGVERDTGTLYAWGQNNSGRLGVGDVASRSSPVAVLGGLKFKKIAVGANSNIGLTESGVAYGWGANTDGELGVGNVVSRSSPVAVLGGLTFQDVFVIPGATSNSFYGLTDEGVLYAWGSNAHGELGSGDVLPKSSPVAVLGGLSWESVARLSGGSRSIVALQKGTGSAYAWGLNTSGELGVGDVVPRSSPVAVLGGLKFSYVNMGEAYAYGAASDGRVYAWGVNAHGQLGDGSVVDRSSPVAVAGIAEPYFEVPTMKVVPVVKGTTYKIKLGGGGSFFGSTEIGRNVRRATIGYET